MESLWAAHYVKQKFFFADFSLLGGREEEGGTKAYKMIMQDFSRQLEIWFQQNP